ncbi:importin-4-like [Drosophila willistoni]|uniref:importin-4-like n=1 Tax=Drosophila willistoni TaxID=7260 RepID=UPI001F07BC6D|nr:importin-4-like [Drosophila willistoni]
MTLQLDQIIEGLLCSDNNRIQLATAEFAKAYDDPETLWTLCQIIVSPRDTQVRQLSAVLLNKRIKELRHWQMVSQQRQEAIKQAIMEALILEKEKKVKNIIAQCVASVIRHDSSTKDVWLGQVLKFIYERCSLPDAKESELGSSTFATLTDSAPDQFVNHMDSICEMFASVLVNAETRGDLASPTVSNIIVGMSNLMPFVSGHTTPERTVLKVMPLLIKAVSAFVVKGNADDFSIVFDIFDSMAEYVPKLFNNNIKPLMEFCLTTANNKQIEDAIRIQVVILIGCIVRLKKKDIAKQKLLEPILQVIFEMMCCETDSDDAEELSTDGNGPVTAATQTLDLLALNMSTEKLIPPLLLLLELALQNADPYRRRAAFLCMAVIADGCAETICRKYLEIMLNIIKSGIADQALVVRKAAFFTLGQFSEHLQPEISKFAPQILPVLFDFLHQLVVELKMGQPEPKHLERMFYALETYCENLEDNIVPHLPLLMDRLFETLDNNNSPRLRELALSAVASTATAAKEHMMPYFPRIVTIFQAYLVKECAEEANSLRIQAIDTLAAITREIGKENFIPLANDTMTYCLMMLSEGPDDPDIRRSIYNLMGALSKVVNESMAYVYPKIMDRVIESVISFEDILPIVQENAARSLYLEGEENGFDREIDLDNTDDEDDELDGFTAENDFVMEKEEAILALKEFATNTRSAFAPYLQSAFENVYKVINHPQDSIRKAAVETICEFVAALHRLGDTDGVRWASEIAMPKFVQIIRKDEERTVVIHLLEVMTDLLREIKTAAVPSQEISELIFNCIKDVLNAKMACQFNEPSEAGDEEDPEDSEYDEILIENAGNLFPMFGLAIQPEQFSLYFGRIFNIFTNKLNKAKRNDSAEQRAFVYDVLADSVKSLGSCVVTYFDILCPLFIGGVSDKDAKVRKNCFFGLGELVLYAEEKSFETYPVILQTLSNAISKELNPSAMDNICGAVARLLVLNHEAVPLAQVLPVFLNHLPLCEDTEENDMILKAFCALYMKAHYSIVDFIEQMLAIVIDVLYKKQMPDKESTASAIEFVKEIRQQYPNKFNNVINSNQEVYAFVNSL